VTVTGGSPTEALFLKAAVDRDTSHPFACRTSNQVFRTRSPFGRLPDPSLISSMSGRAAATESHEGWTSSRTCLRSSACEYIHLNSGDLRPRPPLVLARRSWANCWMSAASLRAITSAYQRPGLAVKHHLSSDRTAPRRAPRRGRRPPYRHPSLACLRPRLPIGYAVSGDVPAGDANDRVARTVSNVRGRSTPTPSVGQSIRI
jgi:hypothetical protein